MNGQEGTQPKFLSRASLPLLQRVFHKTSTSIDKLTFQTPAILVLWLLVGPNRAMI